MSRLSPGQLIAGKLRVEHALGSGAMGEVYSAQHLTLQNRQALKVLLPELAQRPEQVERFLREGVAISRVRHRAVVQVFDAGHDQGIPWIAMELLEGETLAERMRRGGMPAREIVYIAMEVLGGLAASHAQGIVHRDLKPSNIFLARQPDGSVQPKVLDFGVALVIDVNERITAVGTTMGSIQYIAPEQIHASRDVDARADLYSLGAILYEALSGRTPYRAQSVTALLGELAYTPEPDLRMAAPQHPEWLSHLVNQCLARERERRPPDARSMLSILAARYGTLEAPQLGGTLKMQGVNASVQSWPGGSSPGHGASPHSSQPGSNPGSWQGSDPAMLFAQPRPSPLRHLLWISPLIGLAIVAGAFGVWAVVDADDDDGDRPAPIAMATATTVEPAPSQPGPPMVPIAPASAVPPPAFPAVAPTPVAVPGSGDVSGHPCIGRWRGSLRQNDGQRASSTVQVQGTQGQCGSFMERWDSGTVCHYRLANCSANGNVLTASASTPSHEDCTPVRMRFTCEGGQLRFFEAAPGVTVTSTMSPTN